MWKKVKIIYYGEGGEIQGAYLGVYGRWGDVRRLCKQGPEWREPDR